MTDASHSTGFSKAFSIKELTISDYTEIDSFLIEVVGKVPDNFTEVNFCMLEVVGKEPNYSEVKSIKVEVLGDT